MALEIERRFLAKLDTLPSLNWVSVTGIQQGYLANGVRIRHATDLFDDTQVGYITVKHNIDHGTNKEYEYEIPASDALEMLELCKYSLKKTRFVNEYKGKHFEVDVFKDSLKGLCIVEIELPDIDAYVELPNYLGPEITGKRIFSNYSLASTPDREYILNNAKSLLTFHYDE